MLGIVSTADRGEADRLLAGVARRLAAAGVVLGGVVQVNTEIDPDRPCQMDLRLLTDGSVIRISQSLGLHATGCRLDSTGLEEAAGRVAVAMHKQRPEVLIVNKFGKLEVEGRGFRPLIGEALAMAVPVLTSVAAKNRAGFDAFAEGMATELAADEDAVLAWCWHQIGATMGRAPV